MPNQPKTPMLSVRCDRELRDAARTKAQAEGTTLTEVIVSHLRRYVGAEREVKSYAVGDAVVVSNRPAPEPKHSGSV